MLPALEAFRPDLILVSCGYDAAAMDPLGAMLLSSAAFASVLVTPLPALSGSCSVCWFRDLTLCIVCA